MPTAIYVLHYYSPLARMMKKLESVLLSYGLTNNLHAKPKRPREISERSSQSEKKPRCEEGNSVIVSGQRTNFYKNDNIRINDDLSCDLKMFGDSIDGDRNLNHDKFVKLVDGLWENMQTKYRRIARLSVGIKNLTSVEEQSNLYIQEKIKVLIPACINSFMESVENAVAEAKKHDKVSLEEAVETVTYYKKLYMEMFTSNTPTDFNILSINTRLALLNRNLQAAAPGDNDTH